MCPLSVSSRWPDPGIKESKNDIEHFRKIAQPNYPFSLLKSKKTMSKIMYQEKYTKNSKRNRKGNHSFYSRVRTTVDSDLKKVWSCLAWHGRNSYDNVKHSD